MLNETNEFLARPIIDELRQCLLRIVRSGDLRRGKV